MKIDMSFNLRKTFLLLVIVFSLVGSSYLLGAKKTYNFSYIFTGDMEIQASLLSFWFYLEASGSANFTEVKQPDGSQSFRLDSIDHTGYIARTRGLFKKSLKLFTAVKDIETSHKFSEEKWRQLLENPSFESKVKKYSEFPFLLPKSIIGLIQFKRDKDGNFSDFKNDLKLTYVDYEKDSYPYNNVYAIMMKILAMYPPTPSIPFSEKEWRSPTIFIDTYFNLITKLCSRSAKRNIHFEQEEGFQMTGQQVMTSKNTIEVTTLANPDKKILKKVVIREFKRVVKLQLPDYTLLEDRLWVLLENDEGKGLKLESALVLSE